MMLRRPFRLKYPRQPYEVVTKLTSELFPTPQQVYMNHQTTNSITPLDDNKTQLAKPLPLPWNLLPMTEKIKFQKMADSVCGWKTYPTPEFESGIDLFRSQMAYRFDQVHRYHYLGISDEHRLIFEKSPNLDHLYRERLRIWKGYQVIDRIKSHHHSIQRHIPEKDPAFYSPVYLGLYPWEIIKDKLVERRQKRRLHYKNSQKVENFKPNNDETELFDIDTVDIYDRLIDEALVKNFGFKEFIELNSTSETLKQTEDAFKRYKRFKSQYIEPTYRTSYLNYVVQHSKDITRQEINSQWRNMSNREKKSYESKNNSIQVHVEEKLNYQVKAVMKYIFEVGGVEGADEFDWRADMLQKSGGYLYLYRMYGEVFPPVCRKK